MAKRDTVCRSKGRQSGQTEEGGRGGEGLWGPGDQTCMCCCSLFFSCCSWRLHSSSSPTRASSSDTTSSSSCLRAASRPRVSSASAHSSASARSCSARRERSSSSWGGVGGQRSAGSARRMALSGAPGPSCPLNCSLRYSSQSHSSPRSSSQDDLMGPQPCPSCPLTPFASSLFVPVAPIHSGLILSQWTPPPASSPASLPRVQPRNSPRKAFLPSHISFNTPTPSNLAKGSNAGKANRQMPQRFVSALF